MKTEDDIGKGFIMTILVLAICITVYFYLKENEFIENSNTITGKVIEIESIPRRQVLIIQIKDEVKLKTSIAFWSRRRVGDEIKIRVGDGNHSEVKVDEFFYLHKVSMSFFTGCTMLFCILSGIMIFGKKECVNK